jgi:hypothetical protein
MASLYGPGFVSRLPSTLYFALRVPSGGMLRFSIRAPGGWFITEFGVPPGRMKGSWSVSRLIGRYISRSVPFTLVVMNLACMLTSWSSCGTRPFCTSNDCRSATSP